jgi:dienelactone hydrolase
MGGYGAWELAAERPDLFAAVVPICGGFDPTDAARIKDLPIWAFHGQADPTVPVEQTTSIVDALRKLGSGVRMTLYPGVGHNSWENAYATDELYTWLLQRTRKRP